MKHLAVIAAAALLSACTTLPPDSLRAEAEHVSHPLAGWPVSASNTEDALTQVNVIGRWQRDRFYVEHGLGWNIQGANGGGFYGPGLTYTGRVGIELWSKH